MKRCSDLDRLEEPFRSGVLWLLHLIEKEELPLKIYETWRSDELQNKYYKLGTTKAKAGQSAHNFGLAIDLVLDVQKIDVPQRMWRGKLHKDAWCSTTKETKEVWLRYGELAEKIGLKWGGNWRFIDMPHVEMRGWEAYKKDQ